MATEYVVRLSLAAGGDLDEIFSFLADTLRSKETAYELMLEIHQAILSLKTMPYRFSVSTDQTLAEKGYRRVLVRKYLALYLVDKEAQTVTVARVFHGHQDYGKYL